MPEPLTGEPLRAFVIHLERQRERRENVDRLAALLPAPLTIMAAVDGRDLDEAQIGRIYRRDLHAPRYPFPLRTAEIACFMSHRAAWQAIVDSGAAMALVIEDDVSVDPARFAGICVLAVAHAKDGDYVRFPVAAREDPAMVLASAGGLSLFRPRHVALGCHAQLVTRGAALRLLQASETFDRPVDSFLQMSWVTGLWPLTTTAGIAREISDELAGSTIRGRVGPVERLLRGIKRAAYRLGVRQRQTRELAALASAP